MSKGLCADGKFREICPECKSKGEVPDVGGPFKMKKCPTCKGNGYVEPEKTQ